VVWATDDDRGLRAIVAVHSTALGPAVGGCRFHPYPDSASAVIDALRLAEGMTLKSAAAGLDIGGGKAVLMGDPRTARTPELLEAFAEVLNLLGGVYYTAEDVGTTTADMDALRELTPYALGVSRDRGGPGDPSPYTAVGVVAAMTAAWNAVTGADGGLDGCRITIQGVGKVGAEVARLAVGAGARVMVADLDDVRVAELAGQVGASVVGVDAALDVECDVLCPCAMGRVLTAETLSRLRCRVVCGAANNQLAADGVADALAARGIVYVPDFLANAGGIMAVAAELEGFDHERVCDRAARIGARVTELLESSRVTGETPLDVARRDAAARVRATR